MTSSARGESPADDGIAAFAAATEQVFERVASAVGLHVVHFRIAGETVRIELAGVDLRPFVRALAHLETAAHPPSLTIRVCHRVALPSPPWSWDTLRGRGEVPCSPEWAVSYLDDVLSL